MQPRLSHSVYHSNDNGFCLWLVALLISLLSTPEPCDKKTCLWGSDINWTSTATEDGQRLQILK